MLEQVWITARPDLKDNLPEEYYQTICDVFYDEYRTSATGAKEANQEAMDNLEEYGCEIFVPTAEELEPMQNHVIETVWPMFADFFTDYGGQDFLDDLIESIEAAK